MFGFSKDVAREVTHPLWPVRVPFKMSCSVMVEVEVDEDRCREVLEIPFCSE
jgi:hypothetical protein